MQKWLCSAVLGMVFGSVAVLAQGEPPGEQRGPQAPRAPQQQQQMHQQMMQHQMMQHQMAMQQQHMQANQPRCPFRRHAWPMLGLIVLVTAAIHILLAVWVSQDLRRRNTGSGLWIVITLLAGLCGAAVYALVRLGDKPA